MWQQYEQPGDDAERTPGVFGRSELTGPAEFSTVAGGASSGIGLLVAALGVIAFALIGLAVVNSQEREPDPLVPSWSCVDDGTGACDGVVDDGSGWSFDSDG
ncbi:hypothetical protein GCM10022237_19840 [Nocardioides ginsengisoli]|uniref:Uncharacterized protein n=1 Tax=Nocardioides ginsengisoli TaxID=363868 RepID=A0ABW3W879_9ACTN